MLNDLMARAFVTGFFVAYAVVAILVIRWTLGAALRQWRRKARAAPPAARPAPALQEAERPVNSDAINRKPRLAPRAPGSPRGISFLSVLPSPSRPPED